MQALCNALVTGASCTRLIADLNLGAQILMIVSLWIGFYFARTRQIPRHRNMQTTIVVVNLFFIAFVMITSFYAFVIAGGATGGVVAQLMIVHGLLGLLAELTGIYLVLRMRTQLIPPRWRVRNFKLVMRMTLGLWSLIVVLGLGIYAYRYLMPAAAAAPSNLARLQRAADDVAIHADELQAAVARGNLPTAKRHAEHLINLIEGKNGADYGDIDKDGLVEDPGDGTGALNYLTRVREDATSAASSRTQAVAASDQVRTALLKIITDAKTVAQASDLNAASAPAGELVALSQQIDKGASNSVPNVAQLLGGSTTLPPVSAENAAGVANTIAVNLKDFAFVPPSLTIKQGTTVVFVNQDPAKHTATSDSRVFDSADIAPGKSFSFTFNTAGTFPYYCEFHGDKGGVDMAGKIVVQ